MIRLLLLILVFLGADSRLQAQAVYDGIPLDSTTFTFEPIDSLTHPSKNQGVDTTGTALWRIGTTSKSFFSAGKTSDFAIMTDTTASYPLNANDWFTLKMDQFWFYNVIISFRHKYQTTSKHDGGIVEYSIDSGLTWLNLLDSCYVSGGQNGGVTTHNFYGFNDTLLNGTPAFSGTSNGWQYSRFQFFFGFPIKGTASPCLPTTSAYIRFRFVSDDTLESLDGWIIDDLKIERDDYGSAVNDLNYDNGVTIYPNPASDEIIISTDERFYKTATLVNVVGQVVAHNDIKSNTSKMDIKELPPGIYTLQLRGPEAITVERIQKQ